MVVLDSLHLQKKKYFPAQNQRHLELEQLIQCQISASVHLFSKRASQNMHRGYLAADLFVVCPQEAEI
ncbi:hypothetical protein IJ00_00385 [Calothrix sp. 336/3]|nr:hypothetical protein IJ00_00385 [Calothrix sp. 336/3]